MLTPTASTLFLEERAVVTCCCDPRHSSEELKGLRKGRPSRSRSGRADIEDNPASFRDLALEKGLGSQDWARQPPSLSLLLSGWSKPMPLTSHCKTPQSSSCAGQKEPFNVPQHLKGARDTLGPSQVTKPGAPLVPAGNPSPAEQLSPPIA